MMRISPSLPAPLSGCVALLMLLQPVCSQEVKVGVDLTAASVRSAAPEIISMHVGAEELYRQIDYVMGLTNAEEQKQRQTVKDYIDIFLIGVSRTKPVRVDVLMGEPLMRYIGFIPVENLADFRTQNLNSLAIDSRRKFSTLYELSMGQAAKREVIGYMRIKDDYVVISELQEELPLSLPDPRKAIGELTGKYQIAAEGRNEKNEPSLQAVRRESFDVNTRKEMLALVKQLEGETADAFEMRKLFTEHMLDEAGRLYVEAAHVLIGGNVDHEKKTGAIIDLSITPVAGTPLAASFDLLAKRPSDFANVPRTEKPILSGRINHPLDAMRQENLKEFSEFFRRQTKETIAAEKEATDEEKANRTKGTDLFFDLLNKNIDKGELDGFVEVHPAGDGHHTAVGAVRAIDGTAFVEVLKLFPKTSRGQKLELAIETAGDVQIHRFTHGLKDDVLFGQFLGGDSLYFGTKESALWFAAGPGALDELKGAIAKVGEPNTGKAEDPLLDAIVKFGPWMELRSKREQGKPASDAVIKFRKMSLEAFSAGDDQLTLKLEKSGESVVGVASGQPGLLRLMGKMIADFSKENLAEK